MTEETEEVIGKGGTGVKAPSADSVGSVGNEACNGGWLAYDG